MKRFMEYLLESQSSVVNALDKEFTPSFVRDANLNFTPTPEIMNKVFDILNKTLFNNQLAKIPVECVTTSEMQQIFDRHNTPNDASQYYAVFFFKPNWKLVDAQHKNQKLELLLTHHLMINSDEQMTFAFAISSLCHEMIHYYDVVKGDVLYKYKVSDYNEFEEHLTEVWKRKESIANSQCLTIFPNGKNISQKILANFAATRIAKLDEAETSMLNKLLIDRSSHATIVKDKHGYPGIVVF